MIWMLGGYMWLFVHRPFEVWPWIGDLQIERAYMAVMVVFWAVQPNKGWLGNRFHAALVFFTVVLTASWLVSPYMTWPGPVDAVENYYKVIVFYILVVTSVRDEAGLRKLLLLFLGAVAVYMAHSLWEYHNGRCMWRMGITRMVGVDLSYSDPNAFASTLVYALGMTLPFWATKPSFRMRVALVGFTGLACVCILLTGSRAGFMALGVCALLGLLATGRAKTAILSLVLLVCAAPLIWCALPGELQNRYLTIIDPSVGPANAQQSGEGRWEGLMKGYEAWTRSPLIGHGPSSFQAVTHSEIEAHNVYGQVISELGALGALALLGLVACYLMNGWEARRFHRLNPDEPRTFASYVARAVVVEAVLLLLLGVAGHNLLRYQWVWFAAFQAVALHCIRGRQAVLSDPWAPAVEWAPAAA